MGNNPSSGSRSGVPFRKGFGSLGLTRSELDLRCKPSGLYDSCNWEDRTIRRLVADGKLAARLTGTETRQCETNHECPICFLHYSEINVLECCKATICTECYLQVEDPKNEKSNPCPFCNQSKIIVSVAKELDKDKMANRELEEQKVIEASIRAKAGELNSDGSGGNSKKQMNTILLSPEERQNLEDQMRSQSAHPMMTQMRRQEDERRNLHDQEHSRRIGEQYARLHHRLLTRRRLEALSNLDDDVSHNSGFGRPSLMRRLEALNELGDNNSRNSGSGRQLSMRLAQSGNGGLNDLFLIEAALLLSMQEQRRTEHEFESDVDLSDDSNRSYDDGQSNMLRRNPLLRALMLQRSRDGQEDEEFNLDSAWDNRDPLIRSGFLGEVYPVYSEDEEMAMAIAMSLREVESNGNNHQSERSLRQQNSNNENHTGSSYDEGNGEERSALSASTNSDGGRSSRNQDEDDSNIDNAMSNNA